MESEKEKPTENSNNEIVKVENDEKKIYKEHPFRFYVLICYILLAFANAMQWLTFNCNTENFKKGYNLKTWQVNLFSIIPMAVSPVLMIPDCILVDNYSFKLGLYLDAYFCILCSLYKYFLSHDNFVFPYIGQAMYAAMQPGELDSTGKVAAYWFRDEMRTRVTTICAVSDTLGVLFGYVFHSFIIDEKVDFDIPEQKARYKDQFKKYLLLELIITIVACAPTFFMIYSKPKYPPSPSQKDRKKTSALQSLKLLFTNKDYVILLIIEAFNMGYGSVMGTIVNSFLSLYEISDNKISIAFSINNACAIVGAILISSYVDKNKKYKFTMRILCLIEIISLVIFFIVIEIAYSKGVRDKLFIIPCIFLTINAICINGVYSIGSNCACEMTYPAGESITVGFFATGNQLCGILGTKICEPLIDKHKDKKYLTGFVLFAFFLIPNILFFFFREVLTRSDIDVGEGIYGDKKESIIDGKEDKPLIE